MSGWGRGLDGAPEDICPLLLLLSTPSLHPVSLVKLGLILGVGVLHGDAARQDGGHVVAHALVFGLLLPLLLHFPQLNA